MVDKRKENKNKGKRYSLERRMIRLALIASAGRIVL